MDEFFTKKECDRCGNPLPSRKMSWFTDEVLCHECSMKESEVKTKLLSQGKDLRNYEGCGYIPNI
jgi:recombinational DNA repair protein (RecF pathway)